MVLPPREAPGAHPDPRQPRRFWRPGQAQRVHARWPPHHRLWRQPVAAIAELALQRAAEELAAAISASTSKGSRPRSSASSIPRLACRAAFLPARGVRPRRAGDGRAPRGMPTRLRAAAERQAAAGVRRRFSGFGGEQGADPRAATPATPIRWPAERPRRSCASSKATSYRDYLIKLCGCSEEAANCFQGRPLGFFGLGSDAVPAADARDLGYPGFAGLKLPGGANAAWSEPYIYHFPDGNAALRADAGALAHSRASRRAARWTTWWRRRSTMRKLDEGRAGGPHPAQFDLPGRRAAPVTRCRSLCAQRRRCAASKRGMSCSPAFTWSSRTSCRNCRAAARGAGEERQDADLLHQCAGAQLAAPSRISRSRSPRRWASTIRCRSTSRSAWAATPSARSVRADAAASGRTCRARRTRGSMRAPSSVSARASSTR